MLADYVVALVTTKDTEDTKDTDANIRRNCLESLSDFLQDSRYYTWLLGGECRHGEARADLPCRHGPVRR